MGRFPLENPLPDPPIFTFFCFSDFLFFIFRGGDFLAFLCVCAFISRDFKGSAGTLRVRQREKSLFFVGSFLAVYQTSKDWRVRVGKQPIQRRLLNFAGTLVAPDSRDICQGCDVTRGLASFVTLLSP